MQQPFDPASEEAWLQRGRDPETAFQLAYVWRAFPDLPSDRPLAERMEQGRRRVRMLKPLFERQEQAAEAERQRRNFATIQRRLDQNPDDGEACAILTARDRHGYNWDQAVVYRYGRWDAENGREFQPSYDTRRNGHVAAYEQGFRDGGGDPAYLFDAARRANLAAAVETPSRPLHARPLPSTWPKPSDAPRPTPWNRRLLILSAAAADYLDPVLHSLDATSGLIVLFVTAEGFAERPDTTSARHGCDMPREALMAQLEQLLAGKAIDDILIAADDAWLDAIDRAHAGLPLCRNMERTLNSILQRRAQLRIWLRRGRSETDNIAGGHIRWSTGHGQLFARLGSFQADYLGKTDRGHHVRILDAGRIANGFTGRDMQNALDPDFFVSNRRNLKPAMEAALRVFAGALPAMRPKEKKEGG